jgi:hypothetical protein
MKMINQAIKNPVKAGLMFCALCFASGSPGAPNAGNTELSKTAVRRVSSDSCKMIPVKVALGRTTQIVLEQTPKSTLFADKKHFKIVTDPSSPRSLAIIPLIDNNDLSLFGMTGGSLRSPTALVSALNKSFKTNLFVFFDQSNQLMFELQFVEKDRADNILKVTQVFNGECDL